VPRALSRRMASGEVGAGPCSSPRLDPSHPKAVCSIVHEIGIGQQALYHCHSYCFYVCTTPIIPHAALVLVIRTLGPLAQPDQHDAPRLVDEPGPCIVAAIEDGLIAGEDLVREPVVPEKPPGVLDRVEPRGPPIRPASVRVAPSWIAASAGPVGRPCFSGRSSEEPRRRKCMGTLVPPRLE
jgi:hypothetical protein